MVGQEGAQALGVVVRDTAGAFHLERHEGLSSLGHEINLRSALRSPVVETGRGIQQPRKHGQVVVDKVLEQRSSFAALLRRARCGKAGQEGGKAGVGPKQPGHFHQALPPVAEVGGQPLPQMTRLEEIQPAAERGGGNGRIAGDFRLVEQTAGAEGKCLHHSSKVDQRGDGGETA